MARKLHNNKKQNKMEKIQRQIAKEMVRILNKHKEGLASTMDYQALVVLTETIKSLELIKKTNK